MSAILDIITQVVSLSAATAGLGMNEPPEIPF